jgi:hypothetical protein
LLLWAVCLQVLLQGRLYCRRLLLLLLLRGLQGACRRLRQAAWLQQREQL